MKSPPLPSPGAGGGGHMKTHYNIAMGLFISDPKSKVPIHLMSIRAISAIENMEVWSTIVHRVPSPKAPV